VAGIAANVTSVAAVAADVTSVAAIDTAVSNVSSISAAVSNVSSVSAAVSTVSGISADVSTVAADATDIGLVAGSIASVNTVATDIASVVAVSGNIDAIITTANDLNEAVSEIETVANSIESVDIVGGNIDSVNIVAGNIDAVNTVATNVADITNFSDVYLGPAASDPATRNDSSALQEGDLYFNTTDDAMKVYTGSAWAVAYVSDGGFLASANNLSDLTNAATARGNLGLGNTDSPTFASLTLTGNIDVTGVIKNGSDVVLDAADIGVTVQAYDADTAKYDDTTANFSGTLQNGGSNVVVDSDIGSTVQAYDSNLTSFVSTFTLPTTDGTTGQVLQTNGSGTLSFSDAGGGITTGKAIAMAIVFG
jgi:hypothetical protein